MDGTFYQGKTVAMCIGWGDARQGTVICGCAFPLWLSCARMVSERERERAHSTLIDRLSALRILGDFWGAGLSSST